MVLSVLKVRGLVKQIRVELIFLWANSGLGSEISSTSLDANYDDKHFQNKKWIKWFSVKYEREAFLSTFGWNCSLGWEKL